MITFKRQGAQGDLLITKIDALPENIKKEIKKEKDYIVTHSETGHNHVMSDNHVDFYTSANDEFVLYGVVKKQTDLRHLRGFDTHETITVNPGIYRFNRQREYTPEGFRRAAD